MITIAGNQSFEFRNIASAVMVLGGVIQAIIFGNVAILVQNMGEAEKMLQAKLDALQEFLRFHDVPDHVTQKAMDALEYTWNYSQVESTTRNYWTCFLLPKGRERSRHPCRLSKGTADRSDRSLTARDSSNFQRPRRRIPEGGGLSVSSQSVRP